MKKGIKIESSAELNEYQLMQRENSSLKKAIKKISNEVAELSARHNNLLASMEALVNKVNYVSGVVNNLVISEKLQVGKNYVKQIRQIVSIGLPYQYENSTFVEYKVKLSDQSDEVFRFVTIESKEVKEGLNIEFTFSDDNRLKKARIFE